MDSNDKEKEQFLKRIALLKVAFQRKRQYLEQEMKMLRDAEEMLFLAESELEEKFSDLDTTLNLMNISTTEINDDDPGQAPWGGGGGKPGPNPDDDFSD